MTKTMNPDQTAPKGSCLIWVHIVCNIRYLSTHAYEKRRTKRVPELKRFCQELRVTFLPTMETLFLHFMVRIYLYFLFIYIDAFLSVT